MQQATSDGTTVYLKSQTEFRFLNFEVTYYFVAHLNVKIRLICSNYKKHSYCELKNELQDSLVKAEGAVCL